MAKAANGSEFQALYEKAWQAGQVAASAAAVQPMVVSNGKGNSWYVPDGVCGFAWVQIRPATSAFARWLKAKGLGRTAYGGGLQIWISAYNQSMQRKEAHAQAMAKVFSEAGYRAYADSRMD